VFVCLGHGVYGFFIMFASLSLHPYHAPGRGGTIRTSMPTHECFYGFGFRVQGSDLGRSNISGVYQLQCLYFSSSVFLSLLFYVDTSVPSPLPRTRTRRYHQDSNAYTCKLPWVSGL